MARPESRALEAALRRLAERVGLELVSAEQLRRLLDPVAAALGTAASGSGWAALERETRTLYYVEVSRKPGPEERPDLAKVLARLQRVVQAEYFVPWLFLAGKGRAQLLYVHSRGEQLGELRRWLGRHPLVQAFPPALHGSGIAVAVTVPVRVEKL